MEGFVATNVEGEEKALTWCGICQFTLVEYSSTKLSQV